jgi:hypothetical protein
MFQTLSLLVPLRGNPGRRQRMWSSLRATAPAVELVIRLDDDDEDTAAWARTLRPLPTIVIGPRLKGYASLPRFFNEMAAAASGDLLMCGNDDMIFATPNWHAQYIGRANEYPDGLFDIGCMTYPAGAFPFSVVSRRTTRTLGFLNDERLLYSDIFLRDVMGRFSRLLFLPHVAIYHEDPDNGEDAVALTAKLALHENATEYWTLHNRCVNEAVGRLRAAA